MKITWDDLTIDFGHLTAKDLIKDWRWLLKPTMQPILVSSVGDMFLQDQRGAVFWLITGSAELEKVSDSHEQFLSKLDDPEIVAEWFLTPILSELKENNEALEKGQLFGFKKLPVLGGEYSPENFEPTDIAVHFAVTGQLNEQIKDLADGTTVEFVVEG